MKLIKKILIIIVVTAIYLFGINMFSGHNFCYLPVEDKGPGTFGCFYSSN